MQNRSSGVDGRRWDELARPVAFFYWTIYRPRNNRDKRRYYRHFRPKCTFNITLSFVEISSTHWSLIFTKHMHTDLPFYTHTHLIYMIIIIINKWLIMRPIKCSLHAPPCLVDKLEEIREQERREEAFTPIPSPYYMELTKLLLNQWEIYTLTSFFLYIYKYIKNKWEACWRKWVDINLCLIYTFFF